jgi:hypothetical protein
MAALIDLPPELLSRIASYLFQFDAAPYDVYEDHGFCSLRLSCRAIETKTRHTFERAAFSTVAVTLHAKSLQALYITASQKRFGGLIKKLVFRKVHHPVYDAPVGTSTSFFRVPRQHEYGSYGVIELPRVGDDGVYPNDGLTLKERVHLGLQDVFAKTVASTPNLRELAVEQDFMASFWLDSPSRQDQLDELAQRMHQSTNRRIQSQHAHDIVQDDDSDSDVESLHGANQDYDNDRHMDPYHIEAYVYPDYLLYLIATAAHRQGIQLTSLSSGDPSALSIRARTFVELLPALQSLEHLDISMAVESIIKLVRKDKSVLHDLDDKPIADSFSHALGQLQRLRTLTLSFDDLYLEDDRFPMMAKSLNAISQQTFVRLTNVHIHNAYFEGKTLCRFLHNQRSLLRRLCLDYIALPTLGHWRPILALLLGEAEELLDLDLSFLRSHSEEKALFRSRMHCYGREEAMTELQRALDYFSGTLY